MKPCSKSSRPANSRGPFLFGLALALVVLPARACGPFFPNRYLDARAGELLAAPEAYFADELMRLLPAGTPRVAEREYGYLRREAGESASERTAEADSTELRAALRDGGRAPGEAERLTEAYRAARAGGALAPTGTPAEFALYLRGAQAWRRGEIEAARTAWRAVMDLPAEERRHRSVWAAYMLGRSYLMPRREADEERPWEVLDEVETPAEAAETARSWLARAEALAAEGASDVLGLAGEAKGWRARLAAERRDFRGAAGLYLERLAEGDDTAVQSLRRLARRILREANVDEVEACARDAKTRGVVVAFLLSRSGPIFDAGGDPGWTARAFGWAIELRRVGARDVPGADRLAWLAYEGGLFGLAEEWLCVAPADSAETDWLRSKLALRGGDARKGAEWLERALRAEGLRGGHRALAWAELARARMALDEPQAALRAFLNGGHQEDCAYVAERLLTTEELMAVLDGGLAGEGEAGEALVEGLRSLLARRLAREERGSDALRYFSAETGAAFSRYRADVDAGFDASRPAAERAAALWRAARALKAEGMTWVGTELEPDWAVRGGYFYSRPAAESRVGVSKQEGGIFAPTAAEEERIRKHKTPEKRFHHRYEAAQLAWWASSLMPDQDEATARVLCEAGGWLKDRDPKAAEPFYRALVLRCGKTEPGREAAGLRWFPRAKKEEASLEP